jgi:PST family polysaccharide transporter
MIQKIKSFLFKNTSAKQTVAKNTVWLSISNFGGRIIKAGVIIYAARVLGTDGYGVFSYAITLSGFLTLFMDPGINGILVREGSKADEAERREIFSTTLVIKLILLAVGVSVVLFLAPFFSTLPGAREILPIVAAILSLDTLREFFTSLLRAKEKMEWDAAIFLFTNLGILVFGFAFLHIETSPRALSWAYVAGDILGISLVLWLIRKYFTRFYQYFSIKRVWPIINAAWPFAVTGALGVLLTNTDILIISWMGTASDVGIYSAAIRIVQILYLVPMVLQFSTLPLFSRLAHKDDARFRLALERTVSLVFLLSIPLTLGGVILGTPIMALLFGAAYQSGGFAFKLLMVTLLFDFPAAIVSSAMFAYNNQRSLIISSAIGGFVNVVLDLFFIPHWGIAGSAIATIIASAASNSYLWHAMRKTNYFSVMGRLKKMIPAGVIMGIATLLLSILHISLILNIVLSAGIYLLALKMLREPLLWELKQIISPTAENAARP